MVVNFSVARLMNVFSQVEGRAIDAAELEDRGEQFGTRLREHLSNNYGLLLNGIVRDSGTVISYHVDLQTSDAAKINQGLALLNPLSITVESGDVDVLVAIPMYRAVLKENWHQVAAQLTKLEPATWFDRFNAVGTKLVLTPPEKHIAVGSAANSDFAAWCVQNGIPIPRAGAMAERQQRAAAEAKAREAAENARWAQHSHEADDIYIREMPTE